MPSFAFSFNMALGARSPSQSNQARRNKGIQIGKEKVNCHFLQIKRPTFTSQRFCAFGFRLLQYSKYCNKEGIFFGFPVHIKIVYIILQSIRCAIALCLEKNQSIHLM